MDINNLLKTAQGKNKADLVLKNGRIVNVFTSEIIETDLAISDKYIAGTGKGYTGKEEIDLKGQIIAPGFIDGHIHIESSMLTPYQFARTVSPHGTTTIIHDPHEITNVLGIDGIKAMLDNSENPVVDFFMMVPSCVPATQLETSGAELKANALPKLLARPEVLGLAEMMNFPGVINRFPEVMEKIKATVLMDLPVDGHCPGVSGTDLQTYAAAGISSDHECTTGQEAEEKLRAGMYLFIREGSSARNLKDLIKVVTRENSRRCLIVTDDRHPGDLVELGHLDYSLKLAVKYGLDPIIAIQMVTLNPAERFRLIARGALAPGFLADLTVLDNLIDFNVKKVFKNGQLVAENGVSLKPGKQKIKIENSINIDWEKINFSIPAKGKMIRTIGLIEGQIATENRLVRATIKNDNAVAAPDRDIAKIAVIERHRATGNMGLGFVQGMGLRQGALAGTVAHDSHNLIVIGINDQDMELAAKAVSDMKGGLVVVSNQKIIARLPLPIAGLMSDKDIEQVQLEKNILQNEARKLGCTGTNPFMLMSFLALPVIPELKLTDLGLVDVNKFKFIDLFDNNKTDIHGS
jgi:adenine deaminase